MTGTLCPANQESTGLQGEGGRSVRTVRRHQARYVQGGMAALGCEEG
jgi:hypothetical protein